MYDWRFGREGEDGSERKEDSATWISNWRDSEQKTEVRVFVVVVVVCLFVCLFVWLRENSPAKPASPVKLSRDEATLSWNCNWNQAEALQNYQEENKGENWQTEIENPQACESHRGTRRGKKTLPPESQTEETPEQKRKSRAENSPAKPASPVKLSRDEATLETVTETKQNAPKLPRRRELAGVRRWREAGGFSQVVFVVVVTWLFMLI